MLLALEAAVVRGIGSIPRCYKGMLDRADDFGREDGFCRDGSGDRFFPRPQHLVHLAPGVLVHLCVGIHEDAVELGAKVEGVWRWHILDDGIEDVKGGESLWWRHLRSSY